MKICQPKITAKEISIIVTRRFVSIVSFRERALFASERVSVCRSANYRSAAVQQAGAEEVVQFVDRLDLLHGRVDVVHQADKFDRRLRHDDEAASGVTV